MDLLPPNLKDDWIKVIQNLENPKLTIHYLKKIDELRLTGIICSPFYMGMFQNLCKSKRGCHSLANCCKISESEATKRNPEIDSNDLELVKTYLEFVDTSIVDKMIVDKSPIELCITFGEAELMKIIARYSNNLNTPDQYGWVPLKKACMFQQLEIAKILAPLTRDPLSPTSKSVIIPSSNRDLFRISIYYNNNIISE